MRDRERDRERDFEANKKFDQMSMLNFKMEIHGVNINVFQYFLTYIFERFAVNQLFKHVNKLNISIIVVTANV